MKYESTILKRLIDTYGVVGNPRYISEIIKEFIVRGKECYPNLFTYQADWLAHIDEFGLTPEYTVSYTGQHIYAPNTKEKPVKSAILKGNTLVNLTSNDEIYYQKVPTAIWSDYPSAIDAKRCSICIKNIKPNTRYIVKTLSETKQFYVRFYNNKSTMSNGNTGWININSIFTTLSDTNKMYISFRLSDENEDYTDISQCSNILLLEYQDGMENLDIPFFEGMQFVKMPILTTSNEDGTKTNILTVNEDVELRGIGDVRDELDLLSGEVTERIGEIVLDGVSIIPTVNRMGNQNNTISFDFKKSFPSLNSSLIHSLNDTFPDYSGDDLFMSDVEGLSRGWDAISVRINKNRLAQANVEGFKQWLQSNPITVQYQLKTPTIKTVELTIRDKDQQKVERLTTFDGGTHFTTSSQDGSLQPTLTVDVVTDLEETLMDCSLEGNTI